MATITSIEFLSGPLDPLAEERETLPRNNAVEETDNEYGGWIIDVSKIPKETTHIYIYRA